MDLTEDTPISWAGDRISPGVALERAIIDRERCLNEEGWVHDLELGVVHAEVLDNLRSMTFMALDGMPAEAVQRDPHEWLPVMVDELRQAIRDDTLDADWVNELFSPGFMGWYLAREGELVGGSNDGKSSRSVCFYSPTQGLFVVSRLSGKWSDPECKHGWVMLGARDHDQNVIYKSLQRLTELGMYCRIRSSLIE